MCTVSRNQINMVEQGEHLRCNEKTTADNLELVYYRSPGSIPSSFPRSTDNTDTFPPLTAHKMVYRDELKNNKEAMLQLPGRRLEHL